jgi:hypothetical protein
MQKIPERCCQYDGISAVMASNLLQLQWSIFIEALDTMPAEQFLWLRDYPCGSQEPLPRGPMGFANCMSTPDIEIIDQFIFLPCRHSPWQALHDAGGCSSIGVDENLAVPPNLWRRPTLLSRLRDTSFTQNASIQAAACTVYFFFDMQSYPFEHRIMHTARPHFEVSLQIEALRALHQLEVA